MGLLESIRRWVDGETGQDPLQQADQQAQQTRRVWEEFLVKIAREVEAVMQREMFTPPGGPTYIPREYIVFLSNEDDKEWQGEKRRGLLQGLHHVLLERARELGGKTKLASKSFALELRIDGTLGKGEFRVQAVWDESESGMTNVQPRSQSQMAQTMMPESISQVSTAAAIPQPQDSLPHRNLATTPDRQLLDDDTIPLENENESEETETDATVVRTRPSMLYQVEVWHNGIRQAVLPISKHEISIGRGSRSTVVDVPIKGDPEVSRIHATLFCDESGNFWITPKGRNATLLNGRELQMNQSVPVRPDEKIQICSFVLRIQSQ